MLNALWKRVLALKGGLTQGNQRTAFEAPSNQLGLRRRTTAGRFCEHRSQVYHLTRSASELLAGAASDTWPWRYAAFLY